MKNLTKILSILGIGALSFLPLKKSFGQGVEYKYDNKGRLKEEKELKKNHDGKINYFGIEKYNKKGQITKGIYKEDANNDGKIDEVSIDIYKFKSDGRIKVISKYYEYKDGKVDYFEIKKHIENGNKVVSDYSKTEGYREYCETQHPVTEKMISGRMIIEYLCLNLGILKYDKNIKQ